MRKVLHLCCASCIMLLTTITSWAGNIPQYAYTRGTNKYTEFTDGSVIKTSKTPWGEGATVIFADETETDNACTSEGFSIGFDYKLGGRVFNQFAIGRTGVLYFGKDSVVFNGRSERAFGELSYESEYYNTFYGGIMPIASGIYKGDISYKITGEAGNKICTVQFKNMILNEKGDKGKYSVQLRLYENNNVFEIAFKEIETCYEGLGGFYIGMRGWNDDDTMLLTGTGMDAADIGVSTMRVSNMLNRESYIKWDNGDYDRGIQATYTFTPANNPTPPGNAPTALAITEKNGSLNIICDRAQGADATVLLYSTGEITAADLPVDGLTFATGKTFGNSTVLYYGDAEHVSASISKATPGATYHLVALSANGTPAFNRDNYAQGNCTTTQNPPQTLTITPVGASSLRIECTSSYPVLIAVTKETQRMTNAGYKGIFGQPTADLAVNDEIPGGGTIIYKGDVAEFIYEECDSNQIHYFKAWTIAGETISSKGTDAFGIPLPSLTYKPNVENYPIGMTPSGWICEKSESIAPNLRDYDQEPALYGNSDGDLGTTPTTTSLITPALPLDCTSRLTFEYSLETVIPDDKVILGYKPGVFGEGRGLTVSAGKTTGKEEVFATIDTYKGTMAAIGEGGYYTGSSSFDTVTVDFPMQTLSSHICISFSTKEFSHFYIRNISVVATGPTQIESRKINDSMVAYGDEGVIYICPVTDGIINIYGIDGRKVATVSSKAGTKVSLPISAGIYVIDRQKILVK